MWGTPLSSVFFVHPISCSVPLLWCLPGPYDLACLKSNSWFPSLPIIFPFYFPISKNWPNQHNNFGVILKYSIFFTLQICLTPYALCILSPPPSTTTTALGKPPAPHFCNNSWLLGLQFSLLHFTLLTKKQSDVLKTLVRSISPMMTLWRITVVQS